MLTDIYKSIIYELEQKGIEPTLDNIIKRLELMVKIIPER
jgi:hypothetical protein